LRLFKEQKPNGIHGLAQTVRVAPRKSPLFLPYVIAPKTRGPPVAQKLEAFARDEDCASAVTYDRLKTVQAIDELPGVRGYSWGNRCLMAANTEKGFGFLVGAFDSDAARALRI